MEGTGSTTTIKDRHLNSENIASYIYMLGNSDCTPAYSVCTGGGGGTLIYSIYTGWADYFGFKIKNFNIFGDFRNIDYFWGYGDFRD